MDNIPKHLAKVRKKQTVNFSQNLPNESMGNKRQEESEKDYHMNLGFVALASQCRVNAIWCCK